MRPPHRLPDGQACTHLNVRPGVLDATLNLRVNEIAVKGGYDKGHYEEA